MPSAPERVIVIIDGSNFYHGLKHPEFGFHQTLKFDYRKFSEWLADGRKIVGCFYYVGVVSKVRDDPKSQKMVSDQQRLFSYLKSAPQDFGIIGGRMMQHDGGYKEKGVDVQIALDIFEKAVDDVYDTLILVSSDTDLVPAVQKVRQRFDKKVEYVGFSHSQSFGMTKACNITKLLVRPELEKFLPKTLFAS